MKHRNVNDTCTRYVDKVPGTVCTVRRLQYRCPVNDGFYFEIKNTKFFKEETFGMYIHVWQPRGNVQYVKTSYQVQYCSRVESTITSGDLAKTPHNEKVTVAVALTAFPP